MLSLACRMFLRNARPGTTSRHRAHCSSCDEYLTLIERIAVGDSALPSDLGRRLRSISSRSLLVTLVGFRPLPRALAKSLRSILPSRLRLAPLFVGSPIYSLAASYVLVVAIGLGWGNPYDLLGPTVSRVTTSAVATFDRGTGVVSDWLDLARSEVFDTEQSARRLGQRIANGFGTVLEPLSTQGETHGNRQR